MTDTADTVGDHLMDLQFRFLDGTDIGPSKYAPATTVGTIKESILAQWPSSENQNDRPETINHFKLMYAGKILGNNMTLAECTVHVKELLGDYITTMHAVKCTPPPPRPPKKPPKTPTCGCTIL